MHLLIICSDSVKTFPLTSASFFSKNFSFPYHFLLNFKFASMMSFGQCYYLVIALLMIMTFGLANSKFHPIGEKRHVTYPTITVDQSGHGNFSTIQSAINSIPSENNRWICIRVKTGTYREKVTVPPNKPYIILKGEGKRTTEVVWDDHATLAQSPTLTVLADNFIAKSISFTNSYNFPWSNKNGNPRVPAVAAMIGGDKCSFYRCGFFGLQDTLWDLQGRHYFKRCTIVGAVDFIFGTGQSIYEGCTISVEGRAIEPSPGFITAQGRSDPNDGNGFVLKDCKVVGSGLAYLGRPWRDYARVFFYNSTFSNIVQPQGWFAWNMAGHEYQLTFAEYECHGLGSNMSQRVPWETKLNWAAVKQLISISFIDTEGWLQNQPF